MDKLTKQQLAEFEKDLTEEGHFQLENLVEWENRKKKENSLASLKLCIPKYNNNN